MVSTTTNYGWVKPDVGASDDVWGGALNTDLDGIDSVVHGIQVTALGDNRIINGDMRIDQRNNGVAGTASNGFGLDRWGFIGTQASKFTAGRNLNGVVGPVGSPYYWGFQSLSTYALLTGDTFCPYQPIEADMVSDFAWGTASAQSVTLSFWARSSLTGTFSGVIQNYGSTRSYPFSYSLPTANTWAKIAVTIPGDTTGTWVMSGNGGAVNVRFDLGSGATYRTSAGAWASSDYVGVTGAVSVVSTNAATFYVTGVKLEIGSVATPYNRQSLTKSMADCQRYYQKIAIGYRSYLSVSATVNVPISWLQMRAAPTCTLITAGTRSNSGAVALSAYQENSGFFQLAPPAAGDAFALNDLWSLAAEL